MLECFEFFISTSISQHWAALTTNLLFSPHFKCAKNRGTYTAAFIFFVKINLVILFVRNEYRSFTTVFKLILLLRAISLLSYLSALLDSTFTRLLLRYDYRVLARYGNLVMVSHRVGFTPKTSVMAALMIISARFQRLSLAQR